MMLSLERRRSYLRALASRPPPSALPRFLGRTVFEEIPLLELERLGEAPPRPVDWRFVEASLGLLRERRDCQDFAMQGLLRIDLAYGASGFLTAPQKESIRGTLLGAHYWTGQGAPETRRIWWHSENHQVLYHTAEYLAGQRYPEALFTHDGRIGAWHREQAREHLYRWLDWRARFSFSEWNSAGYYDEDMAALLNLVEWAADPVLARQAASVLDLLLLHVAANSWRGITAFAQGRAYEEELLMPDVTAMATVAQLCWGDGAPPARMSLGALLLCCAARYDVPAAAVAAGRDNRPLWINRERHSLHADDAARYGVFPDRIRDLEFFYGSGQAGHPAVVETRYAAEGGRMFQPNEFDDLAFFRACASKGIAAPRHVQPHALAEANLYTCRTPDYVLSCAQAYRSGVAGCQQFVWCAAVGPRAVVFTTNPAPDDAAPGLPGAWAGNGILPLVMQHRNVLVCWYRIRPYLIFDQPWTRAASYTHAWFPRALFDEVCEGDGWCIGRCGEGYVALYCDKKPVWRVPRSPIARQVAGETATEWVADASDAVWICETGSEREHGTFADFVRSIRAASMGRGDGTIRYESPSLGRVEGGWESGLAVNGEPVALGDYPLIENPLRCTAFGAG